MQGGFGAPVPAIRSSYAVHPLIGEVSKVAARAVQLLYSEINMYKTSSAERSGVILPVGFHSKPGQGSRGSSKDFIYFSFSHIFLHKARYLASWPYSIPLNKARSLVSCFATCL